MESSQVQQPQPDTVRRVKQEDLAMAVAHIDPITGEVTPIQGTVSPWPRNSLELIPEEVEDDEDPTREEGVLTSGADIAKGLAKNAGRVLRKGWVSQEIADERYETCKGCALTDADWEDAKAVLDKYNAREGFGYTLPGPNEYVLSKDGRCRICGCPMRGKSKINFPPEKLCPLNRWKR